MTNTPATVLGSNLTDEQREVLHFVERMDVKVAQLRQAARSWSPAPLPAAVPVAHARRRQRWFRRSA
jgi:hypothetical protein